MHTAMPIARPIIFIEEKVLFFNKFRSSVLKLFGWRSTNVDAKVTNVTNVSTKVIHVASKVQIQDYE